jgi:hypothetical protein
MMFKARFHEPIRNGEVTCSLRIWKRPHVKVGGRYKLGSGEIQVDRIHEIGMEGITPALARRSGFASVSDLLKTAKHGAGERVFLVEFHYAGERAADTLPDDVDPGETDVAELRRRLDAMDKQAASGPWTRATLCLIGDNPGMRATDLATTLERPRDDFKRDVRKLKKLGLTRSLEVGYMLSPRGWALLHR